MFLGVDQSIRSSGLAVIEATGTYEPKHLGTIEPKKLKDAPRLKFIRDALQEVVRTFPIKQAALEGYSIASVNRSFDLGEVGGLVRLCLLDNGIPFIVVPPTSLKLFVTGNGQASKEQMQRAVLAKWNQNITQDDACDAYGLAHAARVFLTGKASHRCELEALKSLTRAPKVAAFSALYKPNITAV